MSTYVLVPGAWLGAWVWEDVAERLRRRGHDVHPVTLTGLAEREHERTSQTGLGTHVDDVVELLTERDLSQVVLVGHSYAGWVVTGAAAAARDRIARLVFVDADVPRRDGSPLDDAEPEMVEAAHAMASGFDGERMPLLGDDLLDAHFGAGDLPAEARARLRERATPMPLACLTQPLAAGSVDAVAHLPRFFIRCGASGQDPWWVQGAIDHGWGLERLHATGHWPMLSAVEPLAALLAAPVRKPPSAVDRYEPVWGADERTQLVAMLDFHRDAVVRSLAGLGPEDLAASPVGSGTSLLGLVRHLTGVEYGWFSICFLGLDPSCDERAPALGGDEWAADDAAPVEVLAAYRHACALSRERSRDHGLDEVAAHPQAEPTLRWIMLHMIEETARHAGHADILRELVDATVGE